MRFISLAVIVWIFDLDGTLVEGIPYEEVLQTISDITGVPFQALQDRYHYRWIDLAEAKTYHCSLAKNAADRMKIEAAYAEFENAKAHPTVVPGAELALHYLRTKRPNDTIICWTRGKKELQERTIHATRLQEYFHAVKVVGQKDRDTVIRDLIPLTGGRPFAMIGDSYLQDINPVDGLATARIWVAGSRMNKYVNPPKHVESDIFQIQTISELHKLFPFCNSASSNGEQSASPSP